jgi:hypothetical protein
VTASFEFSGMSDGVRVGFRPDLPLTVFYGLEPTLIPEPPGNTDVGEIYEPPVAVQVGRSVVSIAFDPVAAPDGGRVLPRSTARGVLRPGADRSDPSDHPDRVAAVRPTDGGADRRTPRLLGTGRILQVRQDRGGQRPTIRILRSRQRIPSTPRSNSGSRRMGRRSNSGSGGSSRRPRPMPTPRPGNSSLTISGSAGGLSSRPTLSRPYPRSSRTWSRP